MLHFAIQQFDQQSAFDPKLDAIEGATVASTRQPSLAPTDRNDLIARKRRSYGDMGKGRGIVWLLGPTNNLRQSRLQSMRRGVDFDCDAIVGACKCDPRVRKGRERQRLAAKQFRQNGCDMLRVNRADRNVQDQIGGAIAEVTYAP
ncbi:MAG: hypothetical protein ACREC9_05595 [Methylocella sp.]